MSYKCEQCGCVQPHGIKSHRKVVETRTKTYPYREEAHRDGNDDPGGKGTEIVKEAVVCESCLH